jgi:hypothetical protein
MGKLTVLDEHFVRRASEENADRRPPAYSTRPTCVLLGFDDAQQKSTPGHRLDWTPLAFASLQVCPFARHAISPGQLLRRLWVVGAHYISRGQSATGLASYTVVMGTAARLHSCPVGITVCATSTPPGTLIRLYWARRISESIQIAHSSALSSSVTKGASVCLIA